MTWQEAAITAAPPAVLALACAVLLVVAMVIAERCDRWPSDSEEQS